MADLPEDPVRECYRRYKNLRDSLDANGGAISALALVGISDYKKLIGFLAAPETIVPALEKIKDQLLNARIRFDPRVHPVIQIQRAILYQLAKENRNLFRVAEDIVSWREERRK